MTVNARKLVQLADHKQQVLHHPKGDRRRRAVFGVASLAIRRYGLGDFLCCSTVILGTRGRRGLMLEGAPSCRNNPGLRNDNEYLSFMTHA
jgi:hypothetical protein